MRLNPQAEELNTNIQKNSGTIYSLLSKKGKAIFFPKAGILAQSAEATGKRINATIGTAVEDDGTPMRLKSIEEKLNLSPEITFPYAPSFGRKDLRETWKKMLFEKNPRLQQKNISLPIVTNAVTHGLSMVGYLFSDEGDTIILPNLFWENYDLVFGNGYGAKLTHFRLFNNNRLDLDSLEQKIHKTGIGKKILLLNFPNNPTGYTPTIKEAKEIVGIIKEAAERGNKILVLIDDAYFGLVYEKGIEKQSLFSYLADLHENVLAVKLDGATKEDYVWGFRVGFITYGIKNGTKDLYDALEQKTGGAIRGNISNASNLSQSLVLKAFESKTYPKEKKEKYELLKSRYTEVKRVLQENKHYEQYFKALPFNSGYFMCVELKNNDAEKVRKTLLEKYDIGVICYDKLVRIAFSGVAKKHVAQLFNNLYHACKECQKV